MWTALGIKRLDPGCDVVVLEQDICGGGASGRNGGFVLGWWPKLPSLAKLVGVGDAIAVARGAEAAIGEIADFCRTHGVDAHLRQAGWLWVATTEAQRGAWESVVSMCERLGVGPYRRVPPEEAARRSGSSAVRAGVFESISATVQPARLARGLRRAVLESGVRLHEGTRVRSFDRGRPVRLRTDRGTLAADRLVVAMNAWAAAVPELSRTIVAITSDMVLTAPVPERIRALGWTGNECVADSQTMVDYWHATPEGRIAFGKGGWGIALGGRIGRDFDRNRERARTVEADFRRYYPTLSDVPITHDWCGPIDRTPTSLPVLGRLGRADHICYGIGWSGNGVGPSVVGGKILASLALGRKDEWSGHPLVGRFTGRFPPEPIRFFGAHVVRGAVARKERAEMAGRKPSPLDVRLAKLAPRGLEDKSQDTT